MSIYKNVREALVPLSGVLTCKKNNNVNSMTVPSTAAVFDNLTNL